MIACNRCQKRVIELSVYQRRPMRPLESRRFAKAVNALANSLSDYLIKRQRKFLGIVLERIWSGATKNCTKSEWSTVSDQAKRQKGWQKVERWWGPTTYQINILDRGMGAWQLINTPLGRIAFVFKLSCPLTRGTSCTNKLTNRTSTVSTGARSKQTTGLFLRSLHPNSNCRRQTNSATFWPFFKQYMWDIPRLNFVD